MGSPNLVVGAPGGEWSTDFTGRVYVVAGAEIRCKAGIGAGCAAPPSPNVKIIVTGIPALASWSGKGDPLHPLNEQRDRFGFSIALAGEIGDGGKPDIVVGAPQFTSLPGVLPTGMFGPGYVHVIYGPNATDLYEFVGSGDSFATYGCFGLSVSGQIDIGSVAGPEDGNSDVIVGEPLYDDPVSGNNQVGRVYVYDVLPQTPLVTHKGTNGDMYFGWTVQGLGHFGDFGEPDYFAVCASRYGTFADDGECAPSCAGGTEDPGADLCGRLFVFRGTHPRPCWSVTGENFRDSCGWAMTRMKNVGGPSHLPELVFTTPRWAQHGLPTPPGNDSELGKVYARLR